jgi:hypothetical protein
MTIKIDFHGGTHGHFLEYVSNVYIMQTTPSKTSIFKPPTYSAHGRDSNYLDDRIIICGHFSTLNGIKKNDTDIRIITPTNDNMFFIAVTNLIYKAGDVGFNQQQLCIPEEIRKNVVDYRNNWYSKFNQRDEYIANNYKNFPTISNSTFEFSFDAFFSFKNFCIELNNLAIFLNQSFFPNQSLYELWAEFIQHNQGWQSFIKCNQIIEGMFSNQPMEIDCTVIEEGWINFNLSTMCKMYQGPMFDDIVYPNNTTIAHGIIQEHLALLR